jgi:hypothetical protein
MEIQKKTTKPCAYNATCIFFVLCTLALGYQKKKVKTMTEQSMAGRDPRRRINGVKIS